MQTDSASQAVGPFQPLDVPPHWSQSAAQTGSPGVLVMTRAVVVGTAVLLVGDGVGSLVVGDGLGAGVGAGVGKEPGCSVVVVRSDVAGAGDGAGVGSLVAGIAVGTFGAWVGDGGPASVGAHPWGTSTIPGLKSA